jgi:hypothetical protein
MKSSIGGSGKRRVVLCTREVSCGRWFVGFPYED